MRVFLLCVAIQHSSNLFPTEGIVIPKPTQRAWSFDTTASCRSVRLPPTHVHVLLTQYVYVCRLQPSSAQRKTAHALTALCAAPPADSANNNEKAWCGFARATAAIEKRRKVAVCLRTCSHAPLFSGLASPRLPRRARGSLYGTHTRKHLALLTHPSTSSGFVCAARCLRVFA